MEKKYKIEYLPLFYNDLDGIINYIKHQLNNEIAVENFLNELEQEINKRAYNPAYYKRYISSRNRENA